MNVCFVENEKGEEKISINTEIEIPKEITDQISEKHPDLGVLMQDKYNSKYKDPYPYFTNGKVERLDFLIPSVMNTVSQL